MLRTPDTGQLVPPVTNQSENSQNGHVVIQTPVSWRQIIRKPFWLALIFGALTFLITTIMPKKYEAITTLYFPSAASTSIFSAALGKGNPDANSVPLLGNVLSSPQVASSPQIAIALLNSTTCNTRVAEQCGLPARWDEKMPDVLDKLSRVATFSLDKDGLLDVSVTDTDPVQAARIARSFTDNLTILAGDTSDSMARQNTAFIRDRIQKITKDLHSKQKLLTAMESNSHTISDNSAELSELSSGLGTSSSAGSGASALLGALGASSGMGGGSSSGGSSGLSSGSTNAYGSSYLALVAERDKLKAAVDGTNAEIAKATQQAQTALKQGANLSSQVPVAMAARERLRDLETQLENDRKTLGPDNPTYRRDSLEVQTAQNEFNAEMQREKDSLQMGITPQLADLEAQLKNEQAVLDNYNTQVKEAAKTLSKMPAFQTRLINLQYQIVTDFEILKLQNASLELAVDAESRNMPTFSVIDPATPPDPDKPSSPKRKLATICAAIGGILIGLLWQYWPILRQQWRANADQS